MEAEIGGGPHGHEDVSVTLRRAETVGVGEEKVAVGRLPPLRRSFECQTGPPSQDVHFIRSPLPVVSWSSLSRFINAPAGS